ncbi:MAG TPA: hypothetical protein GX739_05825 [Firmicutes bacterium]|nr:hypothetical protein [Bacillota bacterium]
MNEFQFTQAEMNALSDQSRQLDSLFDQELTEILQGANYLLAKHLIKFFATSISIDGFYAERTQGHLGRHYIEADDVYIYPVNFQFGNTFVMIHAKDAERMADFLNTALARSIELLVEEFVNTLSDFLTEQTGYWHHGNILPVKKLSAAQIGSLTQIPSHIVHYNICFNSSSVELFWLLPGDKLREKLQIKIEAPAVEKQVRSHRVMNTKTPKLVKIESFQFDSLTVDRPETVKHSLEIVSDVTIPIFAELGSTTMRLEDIMKLKTGDVITLQKAAGDPADVYVFDKNVARAEIMVVDDHLGLRILEIESDIERIKS